MSNISVIDGFYSRVTKAPEFPEGFDWINSDEPLTLEKLRGHVVVLDFWTYCCINCMHTLPVLAGLEEKYKGRPVVFVGIHSAKFFNEEDKRNIEHAVMRYEISHPVLVDRKMATWQRYDVSGWPTIVIIDPKGSVVYKQSGEGQKEMIEDTIDVLLERHEKSGTLAVEPIKISHRQGKDSTLLSFPGKVAVSDGLIAISDSNHNRIMVTDMSGKIMYEVGSGRRGFEDGYFKTCSFFRPQGVAWKGNVLFVADTENHAIRKIDMGSGKVSTVVGTGKQGPWMSKGGKGSETSISSPWDVAVRDNLVFIAMAGTHQIWSFDIETCHVAPFAGSGHEDIVDGMRSSARLAQPSGISIFADRLFFADSETSSIREIDLASGFVKTLAGRGLFAFGHKDGSLVEALLQHPLGLAAYQSHVYIADTYNSAIRSIDLEKGTVSTLVGNDRMVGMCTLGKSGCDTLGLYEPGDVKFYQNRLYIADTNNHLIRVYDLGTNILTTLEIRH